MEKQGTDTADGRPTRDTKNKEDGTMKPAKEMTITLTLIDERWA